MVLRLLCSSYHCTTAVALLPYSQHVLPAISSNLVTELESSGSIAVGERRLQDCLTPFLYAAIYGTCAARACQQVPRHCYEGMLHHAHCFVRRKTLSMPNASVIISSHENLFLGCSQPKSTRPLGTAAVSLSFMNGCLLSLLQNGETTCLEEVECSLWQTQRFLQDVGVDGLAHTTFTYRG